LSVPRFLTLSTNLKLKILAPSRISDMSTSPKTPFSSRLFTSFYLDFVNRLISLIDRVKIGVETVVSII
jgi:hypothetical protein